MSLNSQKPSLKFICKSKLKNWFRNVPITFENSNKKWKQLEQIRTTTQIYEKTRIVIIPWGVELNNDEVLLANNVGEVGVVQGENKLLRFRFFSADSSKRRRSKDRQSKQKKANRNPNRHCWILCVCVFVLKKSERFGGFLRHSKRVEKERDKHGSAKHVRFFFFHFLLALSSGVTNLLAPSVVDCRRGGFLLVWARHTYAI